MNLAFVNSKRASHARRFVGFNPRADCVFNLASVSAPLALADDEEWYRRWYLFVKRLFHSTKKNPSVSSRARQQGSAAPLARLPPAP
jgi:hypothetical protein